MTRATDINELRELLQRRRRDLLSTAEAQQAEVAGLKGQDRDPEYEEGAQIALADYTLSQLVETQRRELAMIDAALQRMDEGNYGECIDCGDPISIERLAALPFALRCGEDAEEHEHARRRETGQFAMPTL